MRPCGESASKAKSPFSLIVWRTRSVFGAKTMKRLVVRSGEQPFGEHGPYVFPATTSILPSVESPPCEPSNATFGIPQKPGRMRQLPTVPPEVAIVARIVALFDSSVTYRTFPLGETRPEPPSVTPGVTCGPSASAAGTNASATSRTRALRNIGHLLWAFRYYEQLVRRGPSAAPALEHGESAASAAGIELRGDRGHGGDALGAARADEEPLVGAPPGEQ